MGVVFPPSMKDENKEPKANAIYNKREQEHDNDFNRVKQLIPSTLEGKEEKKDRAFHLKGTNEGYYLKVVRTASDDSMPLHDKIILQMDAEIESLKAKSDNDGWISVKERLPEDCKLVIISGGVGYYSFACNSWFTVMHTEVSKKIHWEVTHWQPLPSPPKPLTGDIK